MYDFRPIIENSYLQIIKGTLNRILYFEFDNILNTIIRAHLNEPESADEKLIITDKYFIYRLLWKAILERLYEKYLPNYKYDFIWEIEVTPYTLMLCELSKGHFQSTEIELQKKLLGLSDERIESEYHKILIEAGFDKIGLGKGLEDRIPYELMPKTRKAQLILLFRLMNFPPLGELSLFQNLYSANLKKQTTDLAIAFSGIDPNKIPVFDMPESLSKSYFHIDHSTFIAHGIDGFEKHPNLVNHKKDFEKVLQQAAKNAEKFKDEIICPCCGEKQEIKLPEDILRYKYLLENQQLSKKIGLLYLSEFTETYINNLSERFHSFIPNINRVDNPDCLILVEGDSEESSIPILAFRKRFILSSKNIQVYNSKSKEKLAADFLSFRSNYPNLKIICLLDFDAKKERDDINRIVKHHHDKYRLIFIDKGTYEDIFDLNLSIDVLNELYPDGEIITISDFDRSKDFLLNIKRIMFNKKKAHFDKALFAKTIAFRADIDNLPTEISEMLQIASDFTKGKNFVKQK